MKLLIFSVYDSKAEQFLPPIFEVTRGTALRRFEASAQQADHEFHRHAGDYSLFELGAWYPQTGAIDMLEAPINLGLAIQYISDNLAGRIEAADQDALR